MRARRLLAALLSLAVVMAVAATPASAKTRPKYKYSFSGTPAAPAMKATWEWPVNKFNKNRRDSDSFAVIKGSGCGTKPSKARWKVSLQSGTLPAQTLIIDFVPNPDQKNPAPVTHAMYPGEPMADVQFTLRFPGTGKTLTLIAKPNGDVASMTLAPSTATLTRKRVKHC